MTPDDVRELLGVEPEATALLFDFDGTLSPIVDDPASAAPVDGAIELLEGLARRYARVAAISGRPRAFLTGLLPAAVDLSGLYGLETRVDGVERDHPGAERWRNVVADAASAGVALPRDVVVEPKGLSLTVHFRRAPAAETEVVAWARDVADRTGLELRTAKASVELHPPLEVDKGTSVQTLADECRVVAFFGDDVGDLPAFAALRRLALRGARTVGVAVAGAEPPDEVVEVADLVVDDPAALVDLLRPLAAD